MSLVRETSFISRPRKRTYGRQAEEGVFAIRYEPYALIPPSHVLRFTRPHSS